MIGAATMGALGLLVKTAVDGRLGEAVLCAVLTAACALVWGMVA